MINIFLIIAVIIVNVALFTYLFVNGKRNKCKSNIIEVLTASGTMISALDTFRKNIPQMSEEFVSDVKPAIDTYIRERVEAYIQASAVVILLSKAFDNNMIIGIIGYFTIPTVAGWIIQAGGMGSYNRSINNTAMTGGSWAGSVAGGVAGNVAGRVGKLLK